MRVRMMITLYNVIDPDQLILVAADLEADGVTGIRLRIPRTSSTRVPHVAKVADGRIAGSIRCRLYPARAAPEIPQRQARCAFLHSLQRLEKWARHRGIVTQGWQRIG